MLASTAVWNIATDTRIINEGLVGSTQTFSVIEDIWTLTEETHCLTEAGLAVLDSAVDALTLN